MKSNRLAELKSNLETAVQEENLILNKVSGLLRKLWPAYTTYNYLRAGIIFSSVLIPMCSDDYIIFLGDHFIIFFLLFLVVMSIGIYGRIISNRIENMEVPLELLQHKILSMKEEINLISIKETNPDHNPKENEFKKYTGIDSMYEIDKKKLILNKLKRLKSIIENKKVSLFSKKELIMGLMDQLCIDKANAISAALEIYKQNFNEDFIDKLKGLTTSYNTIKDLVFPFIELEIIESKYPHNKIINNRKIAAF